MDYFLAMVTLFGTVNYGFVSSKTIEFVRTNKNSSMTQVLLFSCDVRMNNIILSVRTRSHSSLRTGNSLFVGFSRVSMSIGLLIVALIPVQNDRIHSDQREIVDR